ncbi:peptide-methionine (S)-S-oxide reductase MsrA [Rhodobacteraceae bacterium 2CG4]|uniref:Peptide methionine sulfoxide reductase MsrA n=1 Tax=Halovulum marinum TaxID=2662447 RepID=A0A6L5YWK3_9RHOB|nr:peptide-methionine (S)-S-oxide reductase MsrA [Halovulum marinum]MSU88235.1 peptide-methionine (S)-S-oxide reductase MsrA [Halovulum marinum]
MNPLLATLPMPVLVLALMLGAAPAAQAEDLRKIVVAGGCFWCVEADFDQVEGVTATVSGYAGGTLDAPTYKQVVRGGTGHLEVVEISYDADVVSHERIVELFLRSIDPTDAGGQFCDRGHSYTTAVFAATPEERATAEAEIADAAALIGAEIVTPVRDAVTFWPAEEYHQDYYRKNPLRYKSYRQGCRRDARVRQLWGDEAPFAGS